MEIPETLFESDEKNLKSHQSSPEKDDTNKFGTVQTCTVCKGKFLYRFFNEHKKSEQHKMARRLERKPKRQQQRSFGDASGPLPFMSEPKSVREKYYFREGIDVSLQLEQDENLLAAFFSLRLSLDPEYKIFKISRNDKAWGVFGDIVIEMINQNNEFTREAIQCKQIQNTNDIFISHISAEKGNFSLRKQFEALSALRKTSNVDNTFFKLFTLAKLKIAGNTSFVYNDDVIESWQSASAKKQWLNRKVVIALFKRSHPLNTTDNPDDICIFKLLDQNGELLAKEEEVLCKFSMFKNQKKALSLKQQMRMMMENKFGTTRDITEELANFFNDFFKMVETGKGNYKMTKRDVLLKIAELFLTPFMLFLDSTIESSAVKLWEDTIQKFDLLVVKNEADILNKMYRFIYSILKSKIRNVDRSTRSFQINRTDILDKNLKNEIFDLFKRDSCKVTLPYLYVTLWKAEMAPLVLKVENEDNFFFIIKIINFLHAEDLPLKFILITDKKIHYSYFPEHLRIFTNLEDLRKVDSEFLITILDKVTIPILNFSVPLRDLSNLNADFLSKVTPDILLNMLLGDYAFKDILVPLTDDIDNTLVVGDDIMTKIRGYFRGNGTDTETKELSYVVNVNGCPTRMEVPPDI